MKVPEPRKLASGNYFIQLRLNGVSVPVTASTAKECKRQAALIKAEYSAGKREIKKAQLKTLSCAIDDYIEAKKISLSPSSVDSYRRIQHNRFEEIMGKPISDISDWQNVIDKESKTVSAKTLKSSWGFIVSVLRREGIDIPSVSLPKVASKTRQWLDYSQIVEFVAAVRGTQAEIPALLGLHSLRRSEILGLTWDCIDLEKNSIRVQSVIVQNEKHKFVRKETAKTEKSQRTIPIMIPELKTALRAVEVKTGAVVKVSPHYICQQINAVCKKAGLPEIGTHGLRHSFASLAHHIGMPEAECMRIGGWSDANTMKKIYTHISEKDIGKYSNLMSDFYNKANKKTNKKATKKANKESKYANKNANKSL